MRPAVFLAFAVIERHIELPQRLKGHVRGHIIRGGCWQPQRNKAAAVGWAKAQAGTEEDGNEGIVGLGGGGIGAGSGPAGLGAKPERWRGAAACCYTIAGGAIRSRRGGFDNAAGAPCRGDACVSQTDVTSRGLGRQHYRTAQPARVGAHPGREYRASAARPGHARKIAVGEARRMSGVLRERRPAVCLVRRQRRA